VILRRAPRPPVEAKCERKAVKHAGLLRCLHYKLNSLGRRGKDDHVFVTPNGYVWWVEFKREDEDPRALQIIEHNKLIHREQLHSVIRTMAEFEFKLGWLLRLKPRRRPRGW
jgi:hypothetical protein